jgi:hypothetical protein
VDASTVYETETEGGAAATPAPSASGSGGSGGSGTAATGSGFEIDTDAVRSIAGQIAAQGTAAAEVVERLRAALQAAGEPWGTEEIGKKFGHGYTGQVNQSFPALASLGSALAGIANGLVAHADSHDQVEAAVTQKLGSIANGGASGSAQS